MNHMAMVHESQKEKNEKVPESTILVQVKLRNQQNTSKYLNFFTSISRMPQREYRFTVLPH